MDYTVADSYAAASKLRRIRSSRGLCESKPKKDLWSCLLQLALCPQSLPGVQQLHMRHLCYHQEDGEIPGEDACQSIGPRLQKSTLPSSPTNTTKNSEAASPKQKQAVFSLHPGDLSDWTCEEECKSCTNVNILYDLQLIAYYQCTAVCGYYRKCTYNFVFVSKFNLQ